MKVSEKTLELNIGAELLARMRSTWGMRKAYLRGLTQMEERQEGVDFFAHLSPSARIIAFQFKAPRRMKAESAPYRFTLVREQHEQLLGLAQIAPGSVFYVLPFYVSPAKLQRKVPNLSEDTWILRVADMPLSLFGGHKTRVAKCVRGSAVVNPDFKLQALSRLSPDGITGCPLEQFKSWYSRRRIVELGSVPRQNPWLTRGLRVAIVEPDEQA